jgi:anthranilate synthase component 2
MRILVFDNYDSFTYNLVHLVEKILHQKVEVYRNDQIPLEKVKEYDKIILSPGPGLPVEAGLLLPLIREYATSKCILGVCLGHQAIGEAFGGRLVNLSMVYHGVATPVMIVNRQSVAMAIGSNRQLAKEDSVSDPNVDPGINIDSPDAHKKHSNTDRQTAIEYQDCRRNLFNGLPDQFEAGRYHSWIVSEEGFPAELEVTARDANDYIMALRHKTYDVQGVQFHPESVLTPLGEKIMRNWLKE